MYPEPEFPLGYTVPNMSGETLTITKHIRTEDVRTPRGRRVFAEEEVRHTPWFYLLTPAEGVGVPTGPGAIRDLLAVAASGSLPA